MHRMAASVVFPVHQGSLGRCTLGGNNDLGHLMVVYQVSQIYMFINLDKS